MGSSEWGYLGVSEGTLLGSLLEGNPAIWGTMLRAPHFSKPPLRVLITLLIAPSNHVLSKSSTGFEGLGNKGVQETLPKPYTLKPFVREPWIQKQGRKGYHWATKSVQVRRRGSSSVALRAWAEESTDKTGSGFRV